MWFMVAPYAFDRSSTSRGMVGRDPNGLHVELDVHALAEHDAAGIERLVPGEAEILSIERRLREKPYSLAAPRVARATTVLDVQRNLAGVTANGEVANDRIVCFGELLDPLATEVDLRKPLHVEEVRRPQVRISIGYARIDARRLDPYLDLRTCHVCLVDIGDPGVPSEVAPNFRDQHVAHRAVHSGE